MEGSNPRNRNNCRLSLNYWILLVLDFSYALKYTEANAGIGAPEEKVHFVPKPDFRLEPKFPMTTEKMGLLLAPHL